MDCAYFCDTSVNYTSSGAVMSKTDDAIEKALDNRSNKIQLRLFRILTTVCITGTLAAVGTLWNFGIYLYENSVATKAAIDTFIKVKESGGQ